MPSSEEEEGIEKGVKRDLIQEAANWCLGE
jgi:hypothetical protein